MVETEQALLDLPSPRKIRDPFKTNFKFIDLFAGVGGMRIAFENAGGRCVFSSEWDKDSQKTYQTNFGEIPHGDITKIEAAVIPAFDVLLAGFPCQPFSSMGKRAGFEHETQGTLFYDVLRIIRTKRPISFLLENVVGLLNHDKGNTFRVIVESLNEIDYELHYKVLNSADYGVPQHRKRIYIVGFDRNKTKGKLEFHWPLPVAEKVGIGQFIESGVTNHSISEHLQKSYIYKLADGRPQIVDRDSDIQVKTLVATYHKIQRLTGTFVADGPTGLRLLTAEECKAIMGFPKEFKIPVSRTQMYRQMGNSVAVPVVSSIAIEITTALTHAKIKKGLAA